MSQFNRLHAAVIPAMEIHIGVISRNEESTSFTDLTLVHCGCTLKDLIRHRNPPTDTYTFRCKCGLELTIPAIGEVVTAIQRTAIDNQVRELPSTTVQCNQTGRIIIEAVSAQARAPVGPSLRFGP